MSTLENEVFISYAWGGESERIVNEIDKMLQQKGINLIRDKRDLGFKGSIKEFMERIGRGNCVIVVISDDYLCSPNCMFELIEIAESQQFHDRIFPIVLQDANIYKAVNRIKYIKYWEDQIAELNEAIKTVSAVNLQGITDDINLYDQIRDNIARLTDILKDMNTLTPEMHENAHFSQLIAALDQRLKETPETYEISSPIPFDWITIPAGEFLMGSDNEQDQNAEANELPQHPVNLPEYRIARVPVTVEQFGRFIQATHYSTTAQEQGGARDLIMGLTRDDWPRKEGAYWEHPHGPDSYAQNNHPVTCISWDDAKEFCKWAGVRLPTEAEWEKAAGWDPVRKVKRIYPWGNELPDKDRCNFDMQVGDTTPVDRYPAGANGLYDMAGNVWEWTSSLYKEYPYKADDCENLEATGKRVLRGGSFYQWPRYVRCTYRNRHEQDATVSDYGFRVCVCYKSELLI